MEPASIGYMEKWEHEFVLVFYSKGQLAWSPGQTWTGPLKRFVQEIFWAVAVNEWTFN